MEYKYDDETVATHPVEVCVTVTDLRTGRKLHGIALLREGLEPEVDVAEACDVAQMTMRTFQREA